MIGSLLLKVNNYPTKNGDNITRMSVMYYARRKTPTPKTIVANDE